MVSAHNRWPLNHVSFVFVHCAEKNVGPDRVLGFFSKIRKLFVSSLEPLAHSELLVIVSC